MLRTLKSHVFSDVSEVWGALVFRVSCCSRHLLLYTASRLEFLVVILEFLWK